MVCYVGVLIREVKVGTDIDHLPLGLKPMSYNHAVALMVHYLNVRQHKLGTVIIHTVISCSMIVRAQGH